jgi:hypothetical protein
VAVFGRFRASAERHLVTVIGVNWSAVRLFISMNVCVCVCVCACVRACVSNRSGDLGMNVTMFVGAF